MLAVIILKPDEGDGYNVENCVEMMEFEEYEMCLKSQGQSFEHIFISSHDKMNWTSKMTLHDQEHVIKLEPGQIKSSLLKGDKFEFHLNNSLEYHIAFVDQQFHMTNINPVATPLTFLRIGSETETWIYLKVIRISTTTI